MGKMIVTNCKVTDDGGLSHVCVAQTPSIELAVQGKVETTADFAALNRIAGGVFNFEDLVKLITADTTLTKKTAFKPAIAPTDKAHYGGAFQVGVNKILYIKQVIYSGPATIVFWNDGTKSMTKCAEGDTYSKETGLAIAVLKRLVGGDGLVNLFGDWLSTSSKDETITLKDVRKKHNVPEVKKDAPATQTVDKKAE